MNNKKLKDALSIVVFILFALVLVTTQLMANILAKYHSNNNLGDNSQVSSFMVNIDIVDVNNSITIIDEVEYTFTPGKKINLDINLNGISNEVKVKYQISFETLNNIPLEITYGSVDVINNNITGEINPLDAKIIEDIIIEWPEVNNSYLYSGQVDLITIIVVIEQID